MRECYLGWTITIEVPNPVNLAKEKLEKVLKNECDQTDHKVEKIVKNLEQECEIIEENIDESVSLAEVIEEYKEQDGEEIKE